MNKSSVLDSRECPYHAYYRDQVGSGVARVYSGVFSQKGHGIGSFLGSLWRWVSPLIRKGGIALGKKALNVGGKVLGDVVEGKNVGPAFKNRVKEELQGGSGGIKGERKRKAVSREPPVGRSRRTSKCPKLEYGLLDNARGSS